MGDVADMILEGILCEYCGVYIEDGECELEADGYPRLCSNCQNEKKEGNK